MRTSFPYRTLKWRRRHYAVLRYMIENPHAKRDEVASATGYSPTHISRITNNPEFRLYYEHAFDLVLQDILVIRRSE